MNSLRAKFLSIVLALSPPAFADDQTQNAFAEYKRDRTNSSLYVSHPQTAKFGQHISDNFNDEYYHKRVKSGDQSILYGRFCNESKSLDYDIKGPLKLSIGQERDKYELKSGAYLTVEL